jgi:hypothetical protein
VQAAFVYGASKFLAYGAAQVRLVHMSTAVIRPGTAVIVRSATGELHRRAVTGPVPGQDFTVVWLCDETEWDQAVAESRDPTAAPWPVEDVRPV